MVSTRQMTISGPGIVDELNDAAAGSSASSSSSSNNTNSINKSQQTMSTIPTLTSTSLANFRPLSTIQQDASFGNSNKQTIFLLDLPIEILDKIFSYTGYKKVAQMRMVSVKMNQICSSTLNSTFQKLQTQMLNRFQKVKKIMPRRESARRLHPLACECDIVETCYMRLSLLQMTFGKHIERNHCCFFPGTILDEVYNILNFIRATPKLGRPYTITEELFDLSSMAMEYFKEHLESTLPAIAYFNKDFLNFNCKTSTKHILDTATSSTRKNTSHSSSLPSPPQSNMVLRKGIRKIKQGMKRYNNQLTVLRTDLRFCKKKSTEQTKQIAEMQKLLAEQQKQTLEYAARLDENDKKNEEMSMKISTLLQEANKFKTELQYWRSKSPAICNSSTTDCQNILQQFDVPTEEQHKLLLESENVLNSSNNDLNPMQSLDIDNLLEDAENQVQININNIDLITTTYPTIASTAAATVTSTITSSDIAAAFSATTLNNEPQYQFDVVDVQNTQLDDNASIIDANVGSPQQGVVVKTCGKRKFEIDASSASNAIQQQQNWSLGATTSTAAAAAAAGSLGGCDTTKKARRVQNKARCQTNINNVNSSSSNSSVTKTRSK